MSKSKQVFLTADGYEVTPGVCLVQLSLDTLNLQMIASYTKTGIASRFRWPHNAYKAVIEDIKELMQDRLWVSEEGERYNESFREHHIALLAELEATYEAMRPRREPARRRIRRSG